MRPAVVKNFVVVDQSPWYNYEIDRAKMEKKRCEQPWRRHKTEDSRRVYQITRNNEQKIIRKRMCDFYRKKTSDASVTMWSCRQGSNLQQQHIANVMMSRYRMQ